MEHGPLSYPLAEEALISDTHPIFRSVHFHFWRSFFKAKWLLIFETHLQHGNLEMRVEVLFVVRILYLGTQASARCDIWRQITMVMIIIIIIIIKQVIDEMVLCWSMLYDQVSPTTLAWVGHVRLSCMHTCAQTKNDLRGRHWTYTKRNPSTSLMDSW